MAAWDDNENAIITEALAGSEMAWVHLVEKYRIYAYRLAWRITFHEEDALDAVQETLSKMATGLPKFRGQNCLRPWVATVAIREAITICRRRTRTPLPMDPGEVARMVESSGNGAPAAHPAEALDAQRHRALVQGAMEELSPQQRAIVLLGIENDLGPGEIARELGLPANQVRSQQARAVARLRTILNNDDDVSKKQADENGGLGRRLL